MLPTPLPAPHGFTRSPCAAIALLATLLASPVCAATAAGPTPAGTPATRLETYRIDPVHTRVAFAIDHAGFSKAIGTVSGSTGTLRFDPGDWSTARVEVEVPLARIDLGDAAWNQATLARNLLDAERHPVARFVSAMVEPDGRDRARIHGRLTLRGETRDIVLDATLNALKRHPLPPFRRTAGFSATTVLSRSAFGIDAWPSVIGDAVELRIELEASRTRATGAPEESAEPADVGAVEPLQAPPPAADIPPEPTP